MSEHREMTMIECVARALSTEANGPGIADHNWPAWVPAAHVALTAMRQPNAPMYDAGYDATRQADGTPQFVDAGFCLGHAGVIFRAMIDAALSEGTSHE
jgi:hypothetical protein